VFESVQIEDVIGQFVKLKKAGADYKGLSPFTSEKTPSFYVVPKKEIWKDFSSGKGGNAISFLMESQGMTYPEAIKWVADKYGIQVEYEDEDQVTDKERSKYKLTDILKAAAIKYQEQYRQLPEDHPAKSYINSRFSQDQIIKWQIGYAPDSWDFIKGMAVEKGILSECIDAGLVVKKNEAKQFDFFRNRIMIPILDHRNNVVSFGGRIYPGGEFTDKDPKYINGRESKVFDKSSALFGMNHAVKSMNQSREAIVMEGYTDVMAFHEAGFSNTVGCMGTALTPKNVSRLKRYVRTITLAFDGDDAGKRAMIKSITEVLKSGLQCKVIEFEKGVDPEDFVKMHGAEKENQKLEPVA
jgi:DNA primase